MTKLLPKDCLKILVNEFDLGNQTEIAKFLRLTQGRVSQINSSKNLTKTHIKTLLKGAFRKGIGDVNTKLLDSFGKMQKRVKRDFLLVPVYSQPRPARSAP